MGRKGCAQTCFLGAAVALVLAAGGLTAFAADIAGEAPTLQLVDRATVTADWIVLRDVLSQVPSGATAEVLNAQLAPSPPPGTTRTLPVGFIRLRLRRAGVDLMQWTVSGPAQVEVNRPASTPVTDATVGLHETPAAEVVRRGTQLQLLLHCGALTVETSGRLMQDAGVGQVASVRVDATRALVTSRIIDGTTAEVLP